MRALLAYAAGLALCALVGSAVAQPPGGVRCAPMHGPPGTHVIVRAWGIGPGTAVYMSDAYPLQVLKRTRRRLVVVIPADAHDDALLVTNGDEEDSCGTFVVTPATTTP